MPSPSQRVDRRVRQLAPQKLEYCATACPAKQQRFSGNGAGLLVDSLHPAKPCQAMEAGLACYGAGGSD
jgi:hypothetical protein